MGACLAYGWAAFVALDAVFPVPMAFLRPEPAVVVEDKDGAPLRVFLPRDGRLRLPVPLGEVAPVFLETLVASEDRFFRWHPGVNPVAMARALWRNLRAGRVVMGGSTITMQLARLAEPKARTLGAKIVEAFRALQLEKRFTKDELLERYVNLTPYGRNIVGVEAAAWAYFGKAASRLSLGESAILAVLPRSPRLYDPIRQAARAVAARDRLLRSLEDRGVFGGSEVELASRHQPPGKLFRSPMVAPHFCRMLVAREPGQPRLRSTLDRQVQAMVREKVDGRVAWLRRQGLENVAVVVVELETRKVRALLGSSRHDQRGGHFPLAGVDAQAFSLRPGVRSGRDRA